MQCYLIFLFLVIYEFTFSPKNTSMTVYRSNCNVPCMHRWGIHIQLCSYLTLGPDMGAPQTMQVQGVQFYIISGAILSIFIVVVQTHQLLNIPTTELSQLHSASKLHLDTIRNPE
jgi:hypothetical protein